MQRFSTTWCIQVINLQTVQEGDDYYSGSVSVFVLYMRDTDSISTVFQHLGQSLHLLGVL